MNTKLLWKSATCAISIMVFAFLPGCKKETFSVPDEFLDYVHRFENEAKLRGRTVDIENQGLKVEFVNFTGKNYSGLTLHENPTRIEIDEFSWNYASDSYRELMMFHELAHGFLGISHHRNDTLPNGDWQSIMFGDPANGKEHKIEYGEHRDYYLDELFLDHVKHPSWSYRPALIELISPDTAFGLLLVNSRQSKILTIKNKGDKQVVINSITGSDCFTSNFIGAIQPHESVNVSFSFRPTEQKQYADVLEIAHSVQNDSEIQPLQVKLTGEGSSSFATGEWIERTPFPGVARYEAASFSTNGSGFACLGTTYNGNNTKEIWEYNAQDHWVKKNNFPGESRKSPVALSINGKAYLGLGIQRNDFWEYTYSTDSWSRKSDFPGQARVKSVYFSTSVKGYMGLGYDGSSLFKDFWEYDPVADTWTQLPNYPGQGNISAIGFAVNDRIFVGTGCDGESGAGHSDSDFWEYVPSTKTWIKRSDFAGGKTNSAISFTINNYGYVGGGVREDGTTVDKSCWEYDPVHDTWSKKAYMPDFSLGGLYYSLGSTGYFGIGFMTSPYFWEFDPN